MTTVPACPAAPTDFPAAHSMDTTWFAVDGKGHVGCFHTGSDGVVPASWHHMPSRLPDFPAAHSMDTHWFAVDRDGQIAHYFSGENGPVPEAAIDPALAPQALCDMDQREQLARRHESPVDDLDRDLFAQLARAAGEKLAANLRVTDGDQ